MREHWKIQSSSRWLQRIRLWSRIYSAICKWRMIPHCPGPTFEPETLPLLVQIKHAHTTRNTRARTHKRERERKRKRSLSRSRDKEIVAVRTKHTSSRSQGLLATNRRGGKLHCRQRQLLTKEVTWLAHSLNAQPFQQSLHPLCKYNCKMVQKYIIFILLFILLSLNLINLFPLYSFILLY